MRGSVAGITLNRPAINNAIDVATARELMEAAIRCDDDPEIRAGVLTGAGPDHPRTEDQHREHTHPNTVASHPVQRSTMGTGKIGSVSEVPT